MTLVACLFHLPVASEQIDTRPVVYLTFDDGPSADDVTEQVLALLDRYGAKATFFVTGERTRRNGSKIPAILYAGHAIGNHTDSHAMLTQISPQQVETEFRLASEAVRSAGGPPMACFRAPFGATDSRVEAIAARQGMVAVKWSIDTRDWNAGVQSYEIYDSLTRSVGGSVVLLHDGPAKRNRTLVALRDWLAVSAHLYQFKALPACQPYGSGAVFAAADEQEPDLAIEPETLQSLLLKLRSYRFTLIGDSQGTTQSVSASSHELTAKLDMQ